MSEKEKKLIKETVENLKQMDEESLRIMKSNSEILRTRDALDREGSDEKERWKENGKRYDNYRYGII